MNTYTSKPQSAQAIEYMEENEQQILDALNASSVTKVLDPNERLNNAHCGFPVLTVEANGPVGTGYPRGKYHFNLGDFLVISESDMTLPGEDTPLLDVRVLHPAKFHRLYQRAA